MKVVVKKVIYTLICFSHLAMQEQKKMLRVFNNQCRNPSIWLAAKARKLRGCGLRSRPESHITCSRECKECKECEGVNPHTPK
jgi:hypothetical protein